ncbi:hypothetical protein DIPPA_08137 [Diplonema papillatum]|nr:hypothetical protein DIPPA_08137 [Diplonema papillatum]
MSPATAAAAAATRGASASLVSQGSHSSSTWGATGETYGPVMSNVTSGFVPSPPQLSLSPFPSTLATPEGLGHTTSGADLFRSTTDQFQHPQQQLPYQQYPDFQNQLTQQNSGMMYQPQPSEQSPLFSSFPPVPPFPLGVPPITHHTSPFRTHEQTSQFSPSTTHAAQPLQPHLSSSLAESSATATSSSTTFQTQMPITHLSPQCNPYVTRAHSDTLVDAGRYPSDATSSQTVTSTFHTDNDSETSAPIDVVDATFSSMDQTRCFSKALPPAAGASAVQQSATGPYVVLVQFKWGRQAEFLHSSGDLTLGTHVVVSADRGRDMGMVVETRAADESDKQKANSVRQSIVRVATEPEMQRWRVGQPKEEAAAKKMAQRVLSKAGITMKIVHAEYQFDMKKITFHFTSQCNHPDFRQVLDPLFGLLRARIWFSRYTNTELDKKNRALLRSSPEYSAAHLCAEDDDNDDESTEQPAAAPAPSSRHARSHRGRRIQHRDQQTPAKNRP